VTFDVACELCQQPRQCLALRGLQPGENPVFQLHVAFKSRVDDVAAAACKFDQHGTCIFLRSDARDESCTLESRQASRRTARGNHEGLVDLGRTQSMRTACEPQGGENIKFRGITIDATALGRDRRRSEATPSMYVLVRISIIRQKLANPLEASVDVHTLYRQ